MSAARPTTPTHTAAAEKNASPAGGKEKGLDKVGGRLSVGGADEVTIEDLSMPKSMVQRIGKSALPQGTQIAKDAVTAMSKSSTVFINQLAAAAQEYTFASGKKTIQPHDVIAGLKDLEFDFMIPRLEAELAKWKEKEANKRIEYKKKARESKPGEDQKGDEELGVAEEMTAERQLAEESGIATNARFPEPARSGKASAMSLDREKGAKRARDSAGLPVAPPTGDDDEDDDAGMEVAGADSREEEGDVGDDVEEDEDDDGTQEEAEDRVGTDEEGRDRGDETEEQDESD